MPRPGFPPRRGCTRVDWKTIGRWFVGWPRRGRSWETPAYFGPLLNTIDYDDYRKVGSVRMPFTIRRTRGGMTFLQTTTELKLNPRVDDSIFKKPAPQK